MKSKKKKTIVLPVDYRNTLEVGSLIAKFGAPGLAVFMLVLEEFGKCAEDEVRYLYSRAVQMALILRIPTELVCEILDELDSLSITCKLRMESGRFLNKNIVTCYENPNEDPEVGRFDLRCDELHVAIIRAEEAERLRKEAEERQKNVGQLRQKVAIQKQKDSSSDITH